MSKPSVPPNGYKKAWGELTTKQQVFLKAYVDNGFNGAATMRSLGYEGKNVQDPAYRMLRQPKVIKALKEIMDRAGVTPANIILAFMEMAFGADIADFEGLLTGTDTLASLRQSGVDTRLLKRFRITKEGTSIEVVDRQEALAKLAQVYGMLVDKKEIDFGRELSDVMKALRTKMLDEDRDGDNPA